MTLVALLFVAAPNAGVFAQNGDVSPVFPADRHAELREELDFEEAKLPEPDPVKEKEEEADESDDPEDDTSWFDDWDWDISLDFSKPASILILILLLVPLGYLIYRVLGDVEMRRRTKKEGVEEQDEITLEEIEEEKLVATGVSLSLQERAERAGQFDVAVRLLYIQLLKNLQDSGQIKYRKNFSNRDYQIQLSGTDYLSDFRAVTYDYERYWYGKYPIDRLSYRLVQRKFATLNERLARLLQTEEDYD